MRDDEEFWDAVDVHEEERQTDGRMTTTNQDKRISLEEKPLPLVPTVVDTDCLPRSSNKKPLSKQQQPNAAAGGDGNSITQQEPCHHIGDSTSDYTSSIREPKVPTKRPGKLELSPIAKVDPPACGQGLEHPSTLEYYRHGESMSPRSDEDEMSPYFTVVNQDTGEKFDVRDLAKHELNNVHQGESPHHSNVVVQEQTRHNWRKTMNDESGRSVANEKQQLNAEDGNLGEKKMPRWRRGKHQKKPTNECGDQQNPSPEGCVRKSGSRKDSFFGNFALLQELGNVNEASAAVAGGEASDATNTKRGHSGPIWALEFSHDGQFVAWGGEDGCVVVTRVLGFKKDEDDKRASKSSSDESYNDAGAATSDDLVPGILDKDPLHVFEGHTSDVICLSWSTSSFLLSSSKDMTVRLWHVTQPQCLHIFQHSEIVTSVNFHPTHEHFFLTGCFDKKVRIWNIKNGRVQEWQQAQDMITSARFSNDGAMVIVGLYRGQVLFYQTEGMRYFTQIECRNRRGTYRSGRMVTGLEFRLANRPSPGTVGGAVVHGVSSPLEVLVTTNDSRLRLYQTDDFSMIAKFKGLVNEDNYLIRASFSEDGKYIVSGSESGKVILWAADPACVSSSTPASTHRTTAKPLDSFFAASDDSAIIMVSRFIPESSVLACVKNMCGRIDPKLTRAGTCQNSMLVTTDSLGVVRIYARQDIFT